MVEHVHFDSVPENLEIEKVKKQVKFLSLAVFIISLDLMLLSYIIAAVGGLI